jgi:hypothetical protein
VADRNVGLAIAGVSIALVALFISAGVILSLGHTVPTTLWSAASALSGALIGILIPPPTTISKNKKAQLQHQATSLKTLTDKPTIDDEDLAAAHQAIELANYIAPSSALTGTAQTLKNVIDAGHPTVDQKKNVVASASKAVSSASNGADAQNWDLRVIVLAVVAAAAFGLGIWLTFKVGGSTTATDVFTNATKKLSDTEVQDTIKAATTPTVHDTSWKGAADALVALGSAAGGALLGLLTPSPSTAPTQ